MDGRWKTRKTNLAVSFQIIREVFRDIKEIQLRKYYKASEEGKKAMETNPTKVRTVLSNVNRGSG